MPFVVGCLFVLIGQKAWTVAGACHQKYDLLNPYYACATSAEKSEWDYESMREALMEKKVELKEAGQVTHMSIYFRDLKNGPRFGIGEYDAFHPASLLKVPVMIAILHTADRDPGLLDETLTFTGAFEGDSNVEKADETIVPNTPYTIRELLKKMIVYSDNHSKELLVKKLNDTPPPSVYRTFLDLDVLTMMRAPNADYVSIHSYATLFPILYNSGYLSPENSQFALELLSESTYDYGLVAGVPAGTRVAHKFGLRTFGESQHQVHDCGIVYHSSAPYLLCVMTSGSDILTLESAIAEISRMVHEGVSTVGL